MTTNPSLFKLIIIKLLELSYNKQIDIDPKDLNFNFATETSRSNLIFHVQELKYSHILI